MISLIAMSEGDRWVIFEWRNRPAVARHMFSQDLISRDAHDAWFTNLIEDSNRRAWMIDMDGTRVGAAFLTDIDQPNERAAWAFYLADEETRGKGIGSAVEFLVLEEALEKLKLHKLCGAVLSSNPGVLAMHKRFGFVEEGVLRDHYRYDGAWQDVHLIAIFREDWKRTRESHGKRLRERGLLVDRATAQADDA